MILDSVIATVQGWARQCGNNQEGVNLAINADTIKRLHAMTRGQIWDAGQFKENDGDIIERYPDGRERVRFHTFAARQTPEAMAHLLDGWRDCMAERSGGPTGG